MLTICYITTISPENLDHREFPNAKKNRGVKR